MIRQGYAELRQLCRSYRELRQWTFQLELETKQLQQDVDEIVARYTVKPK